MAGPGEDWLVGQVKGGQNPFFNLSTTRTPRPGPPLVSRRVIGSRMVEYDVRIEVKSLVMGPRSRRVGRQPPARGRHEQAHA